MKQYKLIYADPPWWYNHRLNGHTRFGRGAGYYPLMKTTEICTLPVRELAEDRAVLFLWATFPTLQEAFKVIEAWGFRYSTVAFTWIKLNPKSKSYFFGTGYCTKSNAEICLLAWKGRPIKPATDTISSLIVSPRQSHSRKPDEARKRIEQLYPSLSKIELFARPITAMWPVAEGWNVWGNQIEEQNKSHYTNL